MRRLLLSLMLFVVVAVGQLVAGDNDLNTAILKLAAEIKSGKAGDVAAAAKKGELGEFMHVLKPSKKEGIKVGEIDGIEKALIALAKNGVKTESPKDLEQVGYIIQSFGKVTEALPTDDGKKSIKLWKEFSDSTIDNGKKLSLAAKANNLADIKTAASKITQACNGCHSKFRN